MKLRNRFCEKTFEPKLGADALHRLFHGGDTLALVYEQAALAQRLALSRVGGISRDRPSRISRWGVVPQMPVSPFYTPLSAPVLLFEPQQRWRTGIHRLEPQ
jgi:hypothetical protein